MDRLGGSRAARWGADADHRATDLRGGKPCRRRVRTEPRWPADAHLLQLWRQPSYVVNGISAPLGADLTQIDSWRKWSAPLQKSQPMPAGITDYRRYEEGPGHGAFTNDEDGNPLYVYHTWGNGVGGDGRDARVRRVHWAAEGRPVLDMTPDEEVAPANRRVAMVVTTV